VKIILADPRGFCAGVKRAIQSLEQSLELYGAPIYVYHEIVHNTWVVHSFQDRGVVFVDKIEDVPAGSYLLYSAHGVSPAIRAQAEKRRLKTIDATCPIVTSLHERAVRLAESGYEILLIGHEGHDEVVGMLGEAPDRMTLISSEEDVTLASKKITANARVAFLVQTTLSIDETEKIVQRMRDYFPQLSEFQGGDVCYATRNRQKVVRELAENADIVLVVGSTNSSNSRRLAELASAQGVESHLVDGPHEIDCDHWFSQDDVVMVTAGASAPEQVVRSCIDKLSKAFPDSTIQAEGPGEHRVEFPPPTELREM
jgi:4-hydroxy-3-methylbut-2-en-1-yl diphosphate reductase